MKKGFWNKYYEAKDLSARNFYDRRFEITGAVIISLFVVAILSIVDLLFYNFPVSYLTQQTKTGFIILILVLAIYFYRSNLYKIKKKSKREK